MDPQIEYLGEDNKYGVTKSDAAVPEGEELNTPVAQTETKTTSRGLFGFGGKSDTSSSSESESEEGKERQRRRREEKAARKSSGAHKVTEESVGGATTGTESRPAAGGTNYSVDSIEGGKPTGGTDYSAATALEGEPRATGGTDYSGASVEGGHPKGGTDYSGTDLPASENPTQESTAAPEKKHHHLFGL